MTPSQPPQPAQPPARTQAQSEADRFDRLLRRGGPVVLSGGLLAAVILAAAFGGAGMAILVLAAAALTIATAAFWASLRALFGLSPMSARDAYELAGPSAEAERKLAVLRTIKDLDFERSVGRIGQQDHQQWLARLRAQAKSLLDPLGDAAAPARAEAERLVARHLSELHAAEPTERPTGSTLICRQCETANDADAVYCKKCGRRLAEPPQTNHEGPS